MKLIARCFLAVIFSMMMGCSPSQSSENCGVDRLAAMTDDPILFVKQQSISDMEKEEMATVGVDGSKPDIPFGLLNDEWEKFKDLYRDGDCIFYFKTGPESWEARGGIEGYVLVRDGEAIYTLVTVRS